MWMRELALAAGLEELMSEISAPWSLRAISGHGQKKLVCRAFGSAGRADAQRYDTTKISE